jgi:hypothetical protein
MEKMLVLLDIIDRQVIVKGVCHLNHRAMADEWAAQDKHRFVYEVEVLT